MKKINKILFAILAIFCFIPIINGCESTETIETKPWVASALKVEEVLKKIDDSKDYMINGIGLTLNYTTSTTFNFHNTKNDTFPKKTIVETADMSFANTSSKSGVATLRKVKKSNDVQLSDELITYSREDSHYYYKSDNMAEDDGTDGYTYFRGDYNINKLSFVDILNSYIIDMHSDEVSLVEEKTHAGETRYKLTSQAISQKQGLDIVNKRFEVNPDLINTPQLFQIHNKNLNYVISFNYEVGVNANQYITYFAVNYEIVQGINDMNGDREKYLTVKSVTSLKKFGADAEIPVVPEDKDLYTVSTFVDIARRPQYNVVYLETIGEGKVNRTTTFIKGSEISFKYEIEQNGTTTASDSEFYYSKLDEDMKRVFYKLDPQKKTYKIVNISPTFMRIDYTKKLFTNSENKFRYGSTDDYMEIEIREHEVFSVSSNGDNNLLIYSFGTEKPRTELYTLDGFSLEPTPEPTKF